MKSHTKIETQLSRKKNSILIETIIAAKKSKQWYHVAEILSSPTKKKLEINLGKISENSKEGEMVVIPGKVLAQGEIDKKIKIVALNFSKTAMEKILKAKCEAIIILEEIKKNPQAKLIKILEK